MRKLPTLCLLTAFAITSFLFTGCSSEDDDPDPATRLGSIKATFIGTRRDGLAFNHSTEYKFTDGGTSNPQTSSWFETIVNDRLQRNIYVYRRAGSPSSEDMAGFSLSERDGEVSFRILDAATTIVADDRTYFRVNFYSPSASNAFEPVMSDYVFNAATGELRFKYSFRFAKDDVNNSTGNDMQITLDVNVLLYKEL